MRDPWLAFMPDPDIAVPHAPDGPLAGLRFGVKDLFEIAGWPTGCGNPVKLARSVPARVYAPAVAGLLDAGADCAGKTQTDEIAWSMAGINPYFGETLTGRARPDPGRLVLRLGGGSGRSRRFRARHRYRRLGARSGGVLRRLGPSPDLGRDPARGLHAARPELRHLRELRAGRRDAPALG
jgi:amidase